MEPFNVLIVEDDPDAIYIWTNHLQLDAAKIAGSGRPLAIRNVSNQSAAEEAIRTAPPGGYSLILLDLRYPRDSSTQEVEFLGDKWLPALRKTQPDAAIVIVTGWAYEHGLKRAVDALRDHDADEFIPKERPWEESLPRLISAIRHRRQKRMRKMPFLSNVARTSAEDILAAVSRARGRFQRFGSDLSSDAAIMCEEDPGEVFDSLQKELHQITTTLCGRMADAPESFDCADLASDEAAIFEAQLGSPIAVEIEGNTEVCTYREDLRTALREVLQNSIDAVVQTDSISDGAVVISVKRESGNESVTISVRDKGIGFSKAALDTLFQPAHSYWNRDIERHKGMGLYVARRMMHSIGGDLEGANRNDGGAEVHLRIRDWADK